MRGRRGRDRREGRLPLPGATIETAAWICLRGGRILCTRSRGRLLFYIPGGKIEPGESAAQAASREVAEELALRLPAEGLRTFGVFEAPADGHGRGVRVRMTCFTGEAAGIPTARAEIEAVAWLRYGDRDKVAPVDQRLFDHLHAQGLLP